METKEYKVLLNDQPLEKVSIKSFPTHSETYNLLRSFRTVQYENIYVLRRKKGYNTYLFHINYDVVICDKYGKVLDVDMDVKPGSISKHYPQAYYVYYMPVGMVTYHRIKKLDVISISRKWI